MPAKRKKIYYEKKRTKKSNGKFLLILTSLVFVIFFAFVIRSVSHKNVWRKDNRLIMAIHKNNGDIVLSNIDPVAGEIVNITIPQNTEVDAAANYGKWRLGKIWDLGFQEKKDGKLLSSTITSYFNFPVRSWSDQEAQDLIGGGLINLLKGLFLTYHTNMTLGDKLSVGLFSRSLDNIRKTDLDLRNTNVIKKITLEDGSEGYALTGFESAKMNSYFSDYYFSEKPTKVEILDTSSNSSEGDRVGRIVKLMGGNVVSVNYDKTDQKFVCEVGPKKDKRAISISAILGCNLIDLPNSENIDLRIILGTEFGQFN